MYGWTDRKYGIFRNSKRGINPSVWRTDVKYGVFFGKPGRRKNTAESKIRNAGCQASGGNTAGHLFGRDERPMGQFNENCLPRRWARDMGAE